MNAPQQAAVTPRVGLRLVNEVSGSRTLFRATGASTAGAYVEVEQTFRAHSPKPPLHLHPHQDEHFTVVSGQLHAIVGDVESDLHAGDVLDVPRGVPHRMWGAADEPTVVVWRTSPALRTDHLYCELWSAAAENGFEPDPLRTYQVTLGFEQEFQLC